MADQDPKTRALQQQGTLNPRSQSGARPTGRAPDTAQGSCYQNDLSLLHVCRKPHKLVSRERNERDRRRVA
jgi:hypothetical protein